MLTYVFIYMLGDRVLLFVSPTNSDLSGMQSCFHEDEVRSQQCYGEQKLFFISSRNSEYFCCETFIHYHSMFLAILDVALLSIVAFYKFVHCCS